MKRVAIVCALSLVAAGTAKANTGTPWFDDFENYGVTGSSYQAWPGSPQSTMILQQNHAFSPTHALNAPANPGGWSNTYTLSSEPSPVGITGGIETDVQVFDDNSVSNSGATPVNAMLAFAGSTGSATPGFGTDYAELGIISGNTASLNDYVIRVRSYDQAHGTTWFDTGVARSQGFTHLEIIADPNPSAGGDGLYHFLINGNNVDPVGTPLSRNTGVGEAWDRIGSNSTTNANFWYDNFNIQSVPEPASLSLMGLGALGLLGRRRRQA